MKFQKKFFCKNDFTKKIYQSLNEYLSILVFPHYGILEPKTNCSYFPDGLRSKPKAQNWDKTKFEQKVLVDPQKHHQTLKNEK